MANIANQTKALFFENILELFWNNKLVVICHLGLVSGSFEVSCIGYIKDSEINSEWQ